jgi:hypothetical protein
VERVAGAAQAKQSATTSLAVWEVPATVVAGERFSVKIGVKSSIGFDLRGHGVAIRNAAGAVIGEGRLGDTPWPGTDALYWAELSLPTPATGGIAALTAHFSAAGLQPPHTDASFQFTVAVVKAPDHTLTIKVVETESAKPLADAYLRLGAYRATTDQAGSATLRVCKGSYQLHIWKVGYDAPATAVDVGGDTAIQVDAVIVPEENVDRAWKG